MSLKVWLIIILKNYNMGKTKKATKKVKEGMNKKEMMMKKKIMK